MSKKDSKPAKEKEVRHSVLALKNFCNGNGQMIKKGKKTTLSSKELKHFKKSNAVQER